jgi:hypothetical protein
MTITRQDIINNAKDLSTVGLESEMIERMSEAEINAYFTPENFAAMFGECDLNGFELATWALAARGQKFLLENLDLLD